MFVKPRIGDGLSSATTEVFKDEVPRDRIPIQAGDNRLILRAIPGYTGRVNYCNYDCQALFPE